MQKESEYHKEWTKRPDRKGPLRDMEPWLKLTSSTEDFLPVTKWTTAKLDIKSQDMGVYSYALQWTCNKTVWNELLCRVENVKKIKSNCHGEIRHFYKNLYQWLPPDEINGVIKVRLGEVVFNTIFQPYLVIHMAVSFHSWRNQLFQGVNQQPSVSKP